MNTAVRQSSQQLSSSNLSFRQMLQHAPLPIAPVDFAPAQISAVARHARVRVAADNILLRGGLLRALSKRVDIELVGIEVNEVFLSESFSDSGPDLLLMVSRGTLPEDISLIRHVRTRTPAIRIVVFGTSAEGQSEFLQYVRAGVRGYLLPDASPAEVLTAVLAVTSGTAACPISLCGALFAYFEYEGTSLLSGALRHKLGLTRREQQLVPLIARGFTNKEIANHFCLSEQTVKNHLCRMKHRVGADNRIGIVQTCHLQGFLL